MRDDWQDEIREIARKERLARRILGVSESAGPVEIKKAYWLRAMECHPDKNPGDVEAGKRFRNLANAYEFLLKGDSRGWSPDAADAPAGEERIGEFLEGDWGYFCWWRENHYAAAFQKEDDPRPRRRQSRRDASRSRRGGRER